jgi:riboflavin synthase
MFTGLIERVGHIEAITSQGDARRLVIGVEDDAYLNDAVLGESISVNGICLTAVDLEPRRFAIDAVEETMRRTNLGSKEVGAPVNLERALLASARLGGHMVQGHVDGVGTVTAVRPEGEGWWVTVEPPFDLMRYIVEKGSICIDGVSLTVANVAYKKFSVALIPHTRAVTTAGTWEAGIAVNLETDVLAKYVERLMQWSAAGGGWTTVEIQ